jgi:hypothetical protein
MKPILRVPLVVLVTAAAVSLGVVGVHASTQCIRFIQNRVRHHKVSAATAARWAVWDKEHPHWHPKPTPKETWDKLNFACEVPMEQKVDGNLLPAISLSPLELPTEMLAPPEAPSVVANNLPPVEIFPEQPSESRVIPPIYSPEYPGLFGGVPEKVTPPPSCPAQPTCDSPPDCPKPPDCSVTPPPPSTPEPSGWVLMTTGLLAMGGFAWRRKRIAVEAV